MATIAPSLLHPTTSTSSRSWNARPSLTCGSHNLPVDLRELSTPKIRKTSLQVVRGSSLKDNTREVNDEAEDRFSSSAYTNQSVRGGEVEERFLSSAYANQSVDGDATEGSLERPNMADFKPDRKLDNAHLAQPNIGHDNGSLEDSQSDDELFPGDTAVKGSIAAGLLLVGAIGGFGAASYVYKDQINEFLLKLSHFIEGYGAAGYALFVAGYAGLEILAIPAIPLTMSAGLLFGTVVGTILVSISGTIAATAAFLIARYLARDRILKLAEGNKKFLAIDKAIGENGFRVVALLRLSPLLPLSLSNYLYGLTSVDLWPYVVGSWLGMLPGTWAYVSAGAVGRAFIQQEAEGGSGSGGSEHLWTLGIGLLVTVIAATYVTRLAKDAIKDIE